MKKYRDFDILNLTTARFEVYNLKIWERINGMQQNIKLYKIWREKNYIQEKAIRNILIVT